MTAESRGDSFPTQRPGKALHRVAAARTGDIVTPKPHATVDGTETPYGARLSRLMPCDEPDHTRNRVNQGCVRMVRSGFAVVNRLRRRPYRGRVYSATSARMS